jgi:hypothetical protein
VLFSGQHEHGLFYVILLLRDIILMLTITLNFHPNGPLLSLKSLASFFSSGCQ